MEGANKTCEQTEIFASCRRELEQRLCEYIGAPYCVSLNSATTGLLLALKTAGVGLGDRVLCTSFSYFALPDIIRLTGATPVLVDIHPNTYTMDPFCLEYEISKSLRSKEPVPKALIAVDLFGQPCNYDALEDICGRYGIALIEDLAHAFGACLRSKKAGSFGRMAVASFFPAKPLGGTSDGGAVFCHSPEDAARLGSLRRAFAQQEDFLETIQGYVIAKQLEQYEVELECRQELAQRYRTRLEGHVKLQKAGSGMSCAHTHVAIGLNSTEDRAALLRHLEGKGIPCQVFPPCPPSPVTAGDALIHTKMVAGQVISLPIHAYLTSRVVDYICDCVLALGSVKSDEQI